MRVVILGSGRGSNAEAVLLAQQAGRLGRARVVGLFSDQPHAGILALGPRFGVPALYVDPAPFKTKLEGEGEARFIAAVSRAGPDLKHRLAEIGVCRYVGHHLVAHVLRPLSSCAQCVVLVHGSHDKEGGPRAKGRNLTFRVAGQTTSSRGPGASCRELPNAAWLGIRLAHAR